SCWRGAESRRCPSSATTMACAFAPSPSTGEAFPAAPTAKPCPGGNLFPKRKAGASPKCWTMRPWHCRSWPARCSNASAILKKAGAARSSAGFQPARPWPGQPLIVVPDQECGGQHCSPQPAFVAHGGLRHVHRAHNLVGNPIDLFLLVPGEVRVKVHVQRGGQ